MWFEQRQVQPGCQDDLDCYYANPALRRCLMLPAGASGGYATLPHAVHILQEWVGKVLERPCMPYEVYIWVKEYVAAVPAQD